jgi:hypothetical protein
MWSGPYSYLKLSGLSLRQRRALAAKYKAQIKNGLAVTEFLIFLNCHT